ncbi:MAG: hypothetical protein SEPTF4163_001398 [Sporothrix epigloea]
MGWNQSAGLLEDRESVTVIEAGSDSANGWPVSVILKGTTPNPSNVRASRRRLQLSEVLAIKDTPHLRMHELEDDADRAKVHGGEGAQKSAQATRTTPARKTKLDTLGS